MRIRVLSDDKEKIMRNKRIVCSVIVIVCVAVAVIVYYMSDRTKESVVITDSKETVESTELRGEEDTLRKMIYVYVCGQVNNPGVVCLEEGSRVVDVIVMAGGMTDKADFNVINQAEQVYDGQKVYVPAFNEVYVEDTPDNGKVNINTADESELMTLPGIGESKATAIIDYRKANGGFKTIEDIMNIPGIKTSAFNKIKEYICV